MIILNSTTDTLRVSLGQAQTINPMRCICSYREIDATTFSPSRQTTNTNGVTAVDVLTAPPASKQRVVDYLSIFNSDTAAKTVTISYNDNGVLYTIFKAVLGIDEKIEYQDGNGFQVLNNAGGIKTSTNPGTAAPTVTGDFTVVLSADVINNNATLNTMQDVTGLSFAVTNGKQYRFKFTVNFSSAVTTTGSRWSITGPGASFLSYRSQYALTTTSETVNNGLTAYDLPAASNATSASIVGNIAIVEGVITPSADGVIQLRFASEIASSAITAKAGSSVKYSQLN